MRALSALVLLALVPSCGSSRANALEDASLVARGADGEAPRAPSDDASAAINTQPNGTNPRDVAPSERTQRGESCERWSAVRAEPGVTRSGSARGPAFEQVWQTRRGRWLAATRRTLCASDDQGQTFQEKFTVRAPAEISLAQTERRGPWLAVARSERTQREIEQGTPSRVLSAWLSNDDEARSFEPLALPEAPTPILAVFTDRLGTLFASTERALFRRALDESRWEGPLALPGRAMKTIDACGRVLLAQSTVDEDGSYSFRSFDRGRRWHPFRLGVIGINDDRAIVRCLGARGAIEAGRGPLPSHWSFDGGRTWKPAPYDDRARRLARERPDGASAVRCRTGPADTIECQDNARTRLVEGSRRDVEVYAPGSCEHVTALDLRTTVAFGPSCGLLVSKDRGGLWFQRSGAAVASESNEDEGRGGFVERTSAWRLDGSIWWTFDQGARWSPVASVIGRTLLHGVFVDRRRGVFVTSTGWVVATRDGGRNWTYVLRGEVERISAEGSMVYVTTPTTVRVSPDGGVHWWLPGVGSGGARLRTTVEREGDVRLVRLSDGFKVEQRGQRIELSSSGNGERAQLATIEERATVLVAADRDARGAIRVLLSDGTILSRAATASRRDGPRRRVSDARRRSRR
ncbi:MAG: hypothetical protein JNK05_10025 [Myxococcales bacterium]|nr:hypothetical protein [Myxococcales bacterium]